MIGNIGYERRLQALERRAREIGYGVPTPSMPWTPFFFGDGGVGGTFTYSSQAGRYRRIGDICIVNGMVAISAIAVAPTGSMHIAGLPFTAASSGVNSGASFTFIYNFNYSVNAMDLSGVILSAGNTIALYESFDNAAAVAVPAANFTNVNCNLQFFGMYQVAGS